MADSNSIKNWLEDDRPREKMVQKGAAALSNAELLAILISSGTKKKSALDLAREALDLAHNNLRELGRLSLLELQKINGIGDARAITISAAMELGRRRQAADALDRAKISSCADAVEIIMPMLQDLNHESFCVLYMNTANKLIRSEMISSGGMAATVADVRMILKNALLNNATQLIIAHNHPSGNKRPSDQDKVLTRKIKDSAALMDIKLLDHVIIAGNEYFSFVDEGML